MKKPFRIQGLWKYILNCFILVIPVLIWDALFTNKLPDAFRPENFLHGIPRFILLAENISRYLLFLLMLLLPLRFTDSGQKRGLLLSYRAPDVFWFLVDAYIFPVRQLESQTGRLSGSCLYAVGMAHRDRPVRRKAFCPVVVCKTIL